MSLLSIDQANSIVDEETGSFFLGISVEEEDHGRWRVIHGLARSKYCDTWTQEPMTESQWRMQVKEMMSEALTDTRAKIGAILKEMTILEKHLHHLSWEAQKERTGPKASRAALAMGRKADRINKHCRVVLRRFQTKGNI